MTIISTIQSENFRYKLALISLMGIIVGLFVSRAMISIGVVLIGLQFFLKPDITQTFQILYKKKILLLASTLLFVYLLSGLYSENTAKFIERISIKLPLFFMVLGFSALEGFPKKYLKNVLYFFVLLSLITSLISFGMYITNFEEITESYKYAKVIPNIFDISHTRFSLMLAITIFASYYLYKEKHFLFSKKETYFIAFAGIFITLFLHLLSVRSGLLAFYIACFTNIILYTIQHKKYIAGIALLFSLMLLPILVYNTVPTVKNKISYMIIDVNRFLKGENVNRYSDGNRLLSIKLGIEVGNANPLIGVGIGDLQNKIFSLYDKNYPEIEKEIRLTPHNQFVYVYAACGFIGLALFLISSLYPFFVSESYKNHLFISVYVIMFSSFLSEATIENQLGTAVFITFYLIGWYCKPENKNSRE